MDAKSFEFQIDLNGVRYSCIATCIRSGLNYRYLVEITSLEQPCDKLVITPGRCEGGDWHFAFVGGKAVSGRYDKALLTSIGEAIDGYNLLSLL